jgi:hypothetical protein
MFKRLQGLIVGIIIGALMAGGVAFAATQGFEAVANTVKIVVDGKEIQPTDVNGNRVDPILLNGTTYLPIRAVATALNKAVYWDGPNYTVYLGDMGGKLEYPSLRMEDATNIGYGWSKANKDQVTDNYGNRYATAMVSSANNYDYQVLLNMKYSRFKAVVYVKQGSASNQTGSFTIEADGKIIYSSPEISKTTSPIMLDIDITGCNDFKITPQGLGFNTGASQVMFGEGGFYQ